MARWSFVVSVTVVFYLQTQIFCKESLRIGYITGSEKPEPDSTYAKYGQLISGAITMAVNEINNDVTVLPNHQLEFVIAETYGQEETSLLRTVELLFQNISVYVGPQETCIHEGRLAAAFNKPMISYVSRRSITRACVVRASIAHVTRLFFAFITRRSAQLYIHPAIWRQIWV